MNSTRIGFIGLGNMAGALIRGLLQDGFDANLIYASTLEADVATLFNEQYGIHASTNNFDVINNADLIILAVKPNNVHAIIEEVKSKLSNQPILSIAAGIEIKTIKKWLDNDLQVIRAMPNTPALVGSGACALYAEENISDDKKDLAEKIMRAVGSVVWVNDESLLDTVTALSGSGPAYFLLIIEALIEAAVANGLDTKTAELLTLQTALGTAHLALESDDDVQTLRKKVTSKGGTTQAALEVLDNNHIKTILKDAIDAAYNRSKAIAQTFK